MSNEVLIKVENVSKKFCLDFKRSLWYGMKDIGRTLLGQDHSQDELRKDEFWAVKDINFEVRRGECLGLIGHNGAGKSTLLKMLNGLINPDQGKITMRGRVGALIELGAGFNPMLTGRENIYNNGAVLGFSRKEINEKFDAIVDFSEISEFIDSPVQNYSSGMKVRLGFAIAAQLEPDILLIDEVLAVGDLGFIIKCLNRMGELIPKTATIFVTHSMPMMARISTQAFLMHQGELLFHSPDTAEAITQYVNLFEAPQKINQGTGEMDIVKISVYDPSKKHFIEDNSAVLETFDDLKVKFTYRINKKIEKFALFVTMFDGQLREVLSTSSEINQQIFYQNEDRKRQFELTIPKIILATGRYSLTVGTKNPETNKMLCRETNSMFFSVKAIANTWATSVVPGEWKEIEL
jgi:lipopolysaccharide transport system ATP-binding protein